MKMQLLILSCLLHLFTLSLSIGFRQPSHLSTTNTNIATFKRKESTPENYLFDYSFPPSGFWHRQQFEEIHPRDLENQAVSGTVLIQLRAAHGNIPLELMARLEVGNKCLFAGGGHSVTISTTKTSTSITRKGSVTVMPTDTPTPIIIPADIDATQTGGDITPIGAKPSSEASSANSDLPTILIWTTWFLVATLV